MKIPREISEKLHGMTKRDWDEISKEDKADLTSDQQQSLYYFYTRNQSRQWISQKLNCHEKKITLHNKYGLMKIISYFNAIKKELEERTQTIIVFVILPVILNLLLMCID